MSHPGSSQESARRAQQLLGQALRAQVRGAPARPGGVSTTAPREPRELPGSWYLVIALLVGAVVGVGLALLSVLAPGVLPAIG